MPNDTYGHIPAGPTRYDIIGPESEADHEAVHQFIEVLSGPSTEATNAIIAHGRLLNRLSNALAYIATLEATPSDDAVTSLRLLTTPEHVVARNDELGKVFTVPDLIDALTAAQSERDERLTLAESSRLAQMVDDLTAERDTEAGKVARLEAAGNALAAQREKDLTWFMGQDAYYHYAPEQPDLVERDSLLAAYSAARATLDSDGA